MSNLSKFLWTRANGGKVHHPDEVEVCVAGTRQFPAPVKKRLKRRSAIEPVIGHAKHDHALKRNFLLGQTGARINALLAGCGFNLRKLFRFFLSPSSCSA